MMTEQETGVGDSERSFSSTGTTQPQNGGFLFDISEAYKPRLVEEGKKRKEKKEVETDAIL